MDEDERQNISASQQLFLDCILYLTEPLISLLQIIAVFPNLPPYSPTATEMSNKDIRHQEWTARSSATPHRLPGTQILRTSNAGPTLDNPHPGVDQRTKTHYRSSSHCVPCR